MKRLTKVMIVFCLAMTILFSAVACTTTGTAGKDDEGRFILLAPEITLSNNTVSWKEVRYGEKYGVVLNGDETNEIEVTKTSYTIDVQDEQEITVKVRAIGDNEETVSSKYSNEVKYTPSSRLATPQKPDVEEIDGDLKVSWNAISGADSYELELSGAVKKNYNDITDTSYTIAKADIEAVGRYNIRVKAKSDDDKMLDSGFSDSVEYVHSEKLASPAPKYIVEGDKANTITWDKISNAKSYKVYLQKNDGDEKFVFESKESTLSKAKINELINEYNKDADGNVSSTAGNYKIGVQAVNTDNNAVYNDSEIVYTVLSNNADKELELIKSARPENVQIDGNGNVTWSQVSGYGKYSVMITSGEYEKKVDVDSSSFDLAKWIGDNELYGIVCSIDVYVSENLSEFVLEGEHAEYDGTYSKVPDTAPDMYNGDNAEYKDYYVVDSIGDFAYMQAHADKNYIFTSELDGKGAIVYAGNQTLTGKIVGNGYGVKDLKIVPRDGENNVNIFENIGDSGSIIGVTFTDIYIETDKEWDIAWLAETNGGSISEVYMVACTFKTAGSVYGMVKENNGKINNVGVINPKITAGVSASAIAGVNIGTIDNAVVSVGNVSVKVGKSDSESEAVENRELCAAGLVINNRGAIINSVVYNAPVFVDYDAKGYNTTVYVGGMVAKSNGGSIVNSFVEYEKTDKKAIYITRTGNPNNDQDYIGGLIAYADGAVKVSKIYVSRAYISGYRYVSGMIGMVAADGSVNIENGFFRGKIGGTEHKAYIANGSGVTAKSGVYYREQRSESGSIVTDISKDYGVAKSDNEFSQLNIYGFVMSDYNGKAYPILRDMIYSSQYTRESSISNNKLPIVYYQGKQLTDAEMNEMYRAAATDKKGNKLDRVIYGSGENKLILPIFNIVK